jgi:hypothetical protein
MKKFAAVFSCIVGVLTLATTVILLIDRFVYHNGPKAEYVSCDCEEDE